MQTICYTTISFLIILCSLSSAILVCKFYLDKNWWPYTSFVKCVYYNYETPTETFNLTSNNYCTNTSESRCSFTLPICNHSDNIDRNIIFSNDEMVHLFRLSIRSYILLCAFFFTSLCINVIHTIKKTNLTRKQQFLLNFIGGILNSGIIFISILLAVFTYIKYRDTLFVPKLIWIHICFFD